MTTSFAYRDGSATSFSFFFFFLLLFLSSCSPSSARHPPRPTTTQTPHAPGLLPHPSVSTMLGRWDAGAKGRPKDNRKEQGREAFPLAKSGGVGGGPAARSAAAYLSNRLRYPVGQGLGYLGVRLRRVWSVRARLQRQTLSLPGDGVSAEHRALLARCIRRWDTIRRPMCAGCAMAAMAGASGVRSWLQAHHLTWLTPRRLRMATATLFIVAIGISSVGLSGSTTPPPVASHHASEHTR